MHRKDRSLASRGTLVVGTLAGAALACAGLLACSGGDPAASSAGAESGNGSSSSATASPGACSGNALKIAFAPMYSAYDGVHTFQVPAIVEGVAGSSLQWSASDPSMVSIEPQSDTGGVMITTKKAGTVTIQAQAGSLCGTSLLTITQLTSDMWDLGNARYNDGVVLTRGGHGPGGGGGGGGGDGDGGAGGGKTAACTNCHGTQAGMLDVQHTPQQTGGFSDADLIAIFTQGIQPAGGVTTQVMPYDRWHEIHQWSMDDDQKMGIVAYLRALTPVAQGAIDFGGHWDHDGGGGGWHHDGGN